MKKVVLVTLVLLSISLISAGYHPICNPGDNPDIGGVYIAGAPAPGPCYNCGKKDDICPVDFGAECTVVDPDCEEVAFWSLNGNTKITDLKINLDRGKDLKMVVANLPPEYEDGTVSFDVYEQDGGFDDFLNEDSPITATITNGKAVAEYEITADISTLNLNENPEEVISELYFEVSGDWEGASDILNVEAGYDVITMCGDYEELDSCEADAEGVGTFTSTENVTYGYGDDCLRRENGEECVWYEEGEECLQKYSYEYHPDNDQKFCVKPDSCVYSESKTGDCSVDDFFTIKNTLVTYLSEDDCTTSFNLGPLPCPPSLQVPFFGMYGFVMSALVISLIYIFVLLRKEN